MYSVLKVKDGYTLYALKMVYGGFGAFVMVNHAKTFLDISWQRTLGDVPAGGHADDDDREAQVSYNPEDWAFAALSVYTDIIGLFLYALSRLQGKALISHFKTD